MVYTPNPGEGFEFANEVIGGSVPKEYVPGVVKGESGESGASDRAKRIGAWRCMDVHDVGIYVEID